MKIDCSKTLNYLKEEARLCESMEDCDDCPIKNNCHCLKGVDDALRLINAVQKWSDEHPQKTYKDDFFEKFPKAPKDGEGYPVCPPCHIYEVLLQNSCRNCIGCDETWDKIYKE